MPANSVASNFRVGYVQEVTQGTTPASPLKTLRITSGGAKVAQNFAESDEIHLVEVPNAIRLSVMGQGDYSGELSYGALDDLLQGVFAGTWSTNVLKVGSTVTSFTFEDQWTDVPLYAAYKGCIIDSLSISMQQGSKVTFKAGFKALTPPTTASGTTAGTGAQTAAPTNDAMDPIGSVQLAQEGGAGSLLAGAPGLTALTMDISRMAIMEPQLGTTALAGLLPSRFVMKGSFSTYFQNSTLFAKYLGRTDTSLSFTLGGASTKKYNFLMSKVTLTDGGPQSVSKDQPIIQTYSFQAVYDATNTTCTITRTP